MHIYTYAHTHTHKKQKMCHRQREIETMERVFQRGKEGWSKKWDIETG